MNSMKHNSHKDLRAIKDTFDAIAAEFDITRYKPWPQTVEFINELPDNSIVLDLGCGNGRNIKYLSSEARGFKIIGLDFSINLLRIAKDKIKQLNLDNVINFVLGDVMTFPFRDNSLDGALYVAALHHLPSAQLRLASLTELERVLRPGGKAFISVWDFDQERFAEELKHQLSEPPTDREFGDVYVPWTGKRGETFQRFYHLFYADELKDLVDETGLEIIDMFRASDNYHAVVVKPEKLAFNQKVQLVRKTGSKKHMQTPFEIIAEQCKNKLGLKDSELQLLPSKWELLGDVLILRLDDRLREHWQQISGVYADALGGKSVLRRFDKVRGILRTPGVELLMGEREKTETVHIENKVKFKFDPMHIMYSSGNIDERIRISTMAHPDDTIVDMFAGIGYFSLPLAVHSKPKKIIACELNPVAFDYLVQNIELNQVNKTVHPVLGDNRRCISKGIADRIIMGYLKSEHSHLLAALNILKPTGGVIHFHDVGFKDKAIDMAFDKFQESLTKSLFIDKFKVEMIDNYKIKSYGPKLMHVVLDLKFVSK